MDGNFEHLGAKHLVDAIINHHEFDGEYPWDSLSAKSWHDVLVARPECIEHAPKSRLKPIMTVSQWLDVLTRHPELEGFFATEKLQLDKDSACVGMRWAKLLARHPQFAAYKPWKHFRSQDWELLLSRRPEFTIDYERTGHYEKRWQYRLSSANAAAVVSRQPGLVRRFNTAKFTSADWATILARQPQLIDECNLNALAAWDLGRLLKRHPEWLSYCSLTFRSPKEILLIAEHFPKAINHYDLDQFWKISNEDTPWMERYSKLAPYTQWNFSFFYWDNLMTRMSQWVEKGRRPQVPVLEDDKTQGAARPGRRRYFDYGNGFRRLLPERPKARNIRNSLEPVMETLCEVLFQGNMLPPVSESLRAFEDDEDMSYEQLMIRVSMMSKETFSRLVVDMMARHRCRQLYMLIDRCPRFLLEHISMESAALPWMILALPPQMLSDLLTEVALKGIPQLAKFRDRCGNTLLHYMFFRQPLHPERFKFLGTKLFPLMVRAGVAPDAPNGMGYSYIDLCWYLREYLEGARRPRKCTAVWTRQNIVDDCDDEWNEAWDDAWNDVV